MGIMFLPISKKPDAALFERFKDVDEQHFFGDLMTTWIRSGHNRSLKVRSLIEEGVEGPVFISLEEGGGPLSVCVLPRDVFRKLGKRYVPLPEVQHYADKAGHFVEEAWFEERNRRLGIDYKANLDRYVVPPAAIAELILSYGMSSCGEVTISSELIENHNFEVIPVYAIKLEFFGDKSAEGWFEQLILVRTRLEKHLEKNGWKEPKPVANRVYVDE